VQGVRKFLYTNKLAEAVRLLGPVDHGSVLDVFAAVDCYVNCSASDVPFVDRGFVSGPPLRRYRGRPGVDSESRARPADTLTRCSGIRGSYGRGDCVA
jgi:hypothetical protein